MTMTSGPDPNDAESDAPEVWRDGPFLVVRVGAALPDRCVKCNAPADGHTTECHFNVRKEADVAHKVAGHILPVIGLVDGLFRTIGAKQAAVRVGLCREHVGDLRKRAWVGTFLIVLGLTLVLLTCVLRDFDGLLGLVVALIGFVLGMSSASPVSAERIERDWIWIRGADEIFLNTLPTLEAQRIGVVPTPNDLPL